MPAVLEAQQKLTPAVDGGCAHLLHKMSRYRLNVDAVQLWN
jgi:hypothetical protein